MLSGASISETVTALLCLSAALPLLLASSGCNDRHEGIPDEPRLSEASRYLQTDDVHPASHIFDATDSEPEYPDTDEQHQHSALAWLQARQQDDQHSVAHYRQDESIRHYSLDHGVIIEFDMPRHRASPTLKF